MSKFSLFIVFFLFLSFCAEKEKNLSDGNKKVLTQNDFLAPFRNGFFPFSETYFFSATKVEFSKEKAIWGGKVILSWRASKVINVGNVKYTVSDGWRGYLVSLTVSNTKYWGITPPDFKVRKSNLEMVYCVPEIGCSYAVALSDTLYDLDSIGEGGRKTFEYAFTLTQGFSPLIAFHLVSPSGYFSEAKHSNFIFYACFDGVKHRLCED